LEDEAAFHPLEVTGLHERSLGLSEPRKTQRGCGRTKAGIDQKSIPHGWLGDPTDERREL
jgi:hypothetical protein